MKFLTVKNFKYTFKLANNLTDFTIFDIVETSHGFPHLPATGEGCPADIPALYHLENLKVRVRTGEAELPASVETKWSEVKIQENLPPPEVNE